MWEWLFSVCCAHSCHFRVNWPTRLCENKDGIHFFTFKSECHNSYNKLLLYDSANGDIAWCNENNSECLVFCIFLKNTNLFLFKKRTRNWFEKTGGLNWKKNGFFSILIIIFQSFFCDFPLIARSGIWVGNLRPAGRIQPDVMALGHYMCHQFGKSTKSKGSSPAESTYQTDARWRRTAMWREGLKAWVRNIKLPGSKELGRCLFSSDGKGVVKFVMLDNSPAGIMIVWFPLEVETRRAKVPLQWLNSRVMPKNTNLDFVKSI